VGVRGLLRRGGTETGETLRLREPAKLDMERTSTYRLRGLCDYCDPC
jgi:hypothetical protein